MKKVFLLATIAISSVTMQAKGYDYGPEQGVFSISFDASPVLDYVGNLFNGSSNNELSTLDGLDKTPFSGSAITGSYLLTDNLALGLGFGFDNASQTYYSFDAKDRKDGYRKSGDKSSMLKAGLKYYFFEGERVQPTLGADVVYLRSNNMSMTDDDGKVSSSASPENTLGFALNVGVEYFLTSSISLGATVDVDLLKSWQVESSRDDYEREHTKRVESSSFTFGTNLFDGNLSLNFYF